MEPRKRAGRLIVLVQLVQDRKRLAPEALAAEEPVAELVVDGVSANAILGQHRGDPLLEFGCRKTVIDGRVHGLAVAGETALACQDFFTLAPRKCIARIDHCGDWQSELPSEFEIPLVVRRHGHDRAGAVANEHVIGDPDRNRLSVHRVDGIAAGEDAGFLLRQIGAVEVAFARGFLAVFLHGGCVIRRRQAIDERMLGAITMYVAPKSVSGRVV